MPAPAAAGHRSCEARAAGRLGQPLHVLTGSSLEPPFWRALHGPPAAPPQTPETIMTGRFVTSASGQKRLSQARQDGYVRTAPLGGNSVWTSSNAREAGMAQAGTARVPGGGLPSTLQAGLPARPGI